MEKGLWTQVFQTLYLDVNNMNRLFDDIFLNDNELLINLAEDLIVQSLIKHLKSKEIIASRQL